MITADLIATPITLTKTDVDCSRGTSFCAKPTGEALCGTDGLTKAAGHADRSAPLKAYCAGLLLPGERKSVEPMAARLAPDNVRRTATGVAKEIGFQTKPAIALAQFARRRNKGYRRRQSWRTPPMATRLGFGKRTYSEILILIGPFMIWTSCCAQMSRMSRIKSLTRVATSPVRAGRLYFVIQTRCRWISNTVCAPRRYSGIPPAYPAARPLKPSPKGEGFNPPRLRQ